MTDQVSVDRDLWERAEALFQEQDRAHAWGHYRTLSDVRCDCCGLRHAERQDYSCCGHHNHPHEFTPTAIAEALRCDEDCPPWSPFHDRAKTFPFSDFDA